MPNEPDTDRCRSRWKEVSRSAAIIIELYRQGVHDEEQLKTLVFATRGKI